MTRLNSLCLAAVLVSAVPAMACMSPEMAPARDAERAEFVLLVRVTAVQVDRLSILEPTAPSSEEEGRIASYRVERVLKGLAPENLRFAVATPPPTPRGPDGIPQLDWCGDWPIPQIGERWLLYRQSAPHRHTQAFQLHSAEGQARWHWWLRQDKP